MVNDSSMKRVEPTYEKLHIFVSFPARVSWLMRKAPTTGTRNKALDLDKRSCEYDSINYRKLFE